MQIEFTVENGSLRILDAVLVQRSSRASVRIAVALAEDGVISREDAVMRVDPQALSELLHRQVDPRAARDRIVSGIAASPGAAAGRIVLTAGEAQAAAARGEDCILVRRETTPEDIRGMHAARAVLTIRGGITSHAAVIGRGLGVPCVVGASDLLIDRKKGMITGKDGRHFRVGDTITVDGTTGEVLAGEPPMLEPALDGAFQMLLSWADGFRDIGVRANADTPNDAQTARNFAAEGIGLCRTEHMFFEGERIGMMPPTGRRCWSGFCRCSGRISRPCSGSCRGSLSASACSTLRCTSSCRPTRRGCGNWPRALRCLWPMSRRGSRRWPSITRCWGCVGCGWGSRCPRSMTCRRGRSFRRR
jgi:pyruvate,orthophosphate dikinase